MRFLLTLPLLLACVAVGRGQPAPMAATPPAPQAPKWPDEIGGKDLKGWLAELKESPDGAMRETASKVIPHFGPSARKLALQPLIDAAHKENDPGPKVNLLMVLGAIGAESPEEAKKITGELRYTISNSSPGSPFRLHAVRGLASYSNWATESDVLSLSRCLEDPAWETRRAAAQSLGVIGRTNDKRKDPAKYLVQVLDILSKHVRKEKSVPVRLELVQSMVIIGPPSTPNPAEYAQLVDPYCLAVKEQLKDEKDKAIQVWLTLLHMSFDGSQFTDKNIEKIASYVPAADVGGRIAALRALALLHDKAKPVVPIMADALRSDDPSIVVEAINALAALEVTARPALPELEKVKATHKEAGIKDIAGQAIDIIIGKKPAAPPQANPPQANPPQANPPPKKT